MAKIDGRETMDLTDWKYLFNFGYSGDIYGKDNKRVIVDRDTGQVIIEYEMATYASSTPESQRESRPTPIFLSLDLTESKIGRFSG